jgi:hypothetical protein
VEQDRQEDEQDLHDPEDAQVVELVDLIDGVLEGVRSGQDAGVDRKMHAEERPHRDDARERVQPSNQKVVPFGEWLRGGGDFSHSLASFLTDALPEQGRGRSAQR